MKPDPRESIDHDGDYVVTALRNGVRLYLTPEQGYSIIPSRADRFGSWDGANRAARAEEQERAFGWSVGRVVGSRALLIGVITPMSFDDVRGER